MARDFQFVPALWSEAIMEKMFPGSKLRREIREILDRLPPMKIDPNLEAFFVAIALQHGTHPMPKFGVERNTLAMQITEIMSKHEGAPAILEKVRKNYRELGGRILDSDPQWFYTKLADAYLTWLYEQEESKALLPEALEKIEADRAQTLQGQQAYKNRMRVFKI